MTALTLFAMFTFGCLAVAFAPESHIGKAFQRLFVESPARLLNVGPLKMFVALVVLVVLAAIAVAAPEMVPLMGMADLSLYLDLAVLPLILGAANGLTDACVGVAAAAKRYVARIRLMRLRPGRLGLRAQRTRRPRRSKPDDDASPFGVWAIA